MKTLRGNEVAKNLTLLELADAVIAMIPADASTTLQCGSSN